jgi:hypothetical protein
VVKIFVVNCFRMCHHIISKHNVDLSFLETPKKTPVPANKSTIPVYLPNLTSAGLRQHRFVCWTCLTTSLKYPLFFLPLYPLTFLSLQISINSLTVLSEKSVLVSVAVCVFILSFLFFIHSNNKCRDGTYNIIYSTLYYSI